MDSPGNMPMSLGGTVWVGELRGGYAGFHTGSLLTLPGDNAAGDPTNGGDFVRPAVNACIVDWPLHPWPQPWQPWVTPDTTPPHVPPVQPHTHCHFERPAQLSDADVERIARRVAELLREQKP